MIFSLKTEDIYWRQNRWRLQRTHFVPFLITNPSKTVKTESSRDFLYILTELISNPSPLFLNRHTPKTPTPFYLRRQMGNRSDIDPIENLNLYSDNPYFRKIRFAVFKVLYRQYYWTPPSGLKWWRHHHHHQHCDLGYYEIYDLNWYLFVYNLATALIWGMTS